MGTEGDGSECEGWELLVTVVMCDGLVRSGLVVVVGCLV